ncbi:MAG: hypothetical protein KDC26_05795 [Armatimonadetes bacterium]|nr:hypothetical protein [Armatimonadota bacterium]
MEKLQFNNGLILSLVLGCSLIGCTQPPLADDTAHFFALDTSESAKEIHADLGSDMRYELMQVPANGQVVVFRFDSSPAEVHAGSPPSSEEETVHLIKRMMEHSSNTNGTNLARLLKVMDESQKRIGKPFAISIYSDCGIENMTQEEIASAQEIVKRWESDSKFQGMTLYGIRDGWREKFRQIIPLKDDLFQIK